MNKMIVDNQTDLSDIDALYAVCRVVKGGRISYGGKQYCYATKFSMGDDPKKIIVTTDLNKKSDRFVIRYAE